MPHHRYLGTTHFFNFTLLTRVALNHQCVCVENHRELVSGDGDDGDDNNDEDYDDDDDDKRNTFHFLLVCLRSK